MDIFLEDVLYADAGAFDADVVVGENGKVVSEGGGGGLQIGHGGNSSDLDGLSLSLV